MTSPVGNATDIAIQGLIAAQTQADTAARNIANGGSSVPYGASGPAAPTAPPVTGTQPGNIAGQVRQALGSTGGTDETTQLVALINARNSFAANLDTLKTSEQVTQQAIDIVS